MNIGGLLRRRKGVRGAVLAISAAVSLSACSSQMAMTHPGDSILSKPVPQVTRLETEDDGGKTRIIVEGEIPLTYASFRLTDPPRLIVDLAGVSFGKFGETLQVGKGVVEEIRPVETDIPSKVARLEVLLKESAATRIEKEGNRLEIEVSAPRSAARTDSASVPTAEMPAPESSSESSVPARAGLIQAEIVPATVTVPEAVSPLPVKAVEAVPSKEPEPSPRMPSTASDGEPPKSSAQESGKESTQEKGSEPKRKTEAPKALPPVPAPAKTGQNEPSSGKYSGKKVSLDFQEAEVTNVLRLLAEVGGKNIVIGENVKGKVTLKMMSVPWDQALDIVLRTKGLGMTHENNVILIDTQADIAKQQEDAARAKDAQVRAEDLETVIIPVNYGHAKDMLEPLKKVLSARGEMVVDERTNTLLVREISNRIDEVKKLVKILDLPTPQVLIEARIVQADTNFARDLGVQWGGGFSTVSGASTFGVQGGIVGAATNPLTGFAIDLPASGVAGTLGGFGMTFGRLTGSPVNLDLRLSAGESRGLTKIVSSPKITTLDNREAKIEQGQSIPYTTTSANLGTKTEFIDAALTLTVTPKVTSDGHVNMKLKITKNRPGIISSEGVPQIDKKEASTEVLVKDGETTVIGGIYELTDDDTVLGVPWFYKLPVIGYLFKRTSKSDRKSELLIFITPRIVAPAT